MGEPHTRWILCVASNTHFLNGELPIHPGASPIFADVRGLALTLIKMGENEIMLRGATRLACHLGDNRVRASLEIWPGKFHVWHLFARLLHEAAWAFRNAVSFLEDALPAVKEQ